MLQESYWIWNFCLQKITRNISMIIIPKKKKNNRPVWMCAKNITLLCLQREKYVLWWWNSLKRDWVSTERPCSKNNEPMPWARRWLLWERREAGSRWGRTSWHMSRGKTESPATAWDEGQRKKRWSKRTRCLLYGHLQSLVTTDLERWAMAQWHHFVWQVFRQRPVRIPVPHIRLQSMTSPGYFSYYDPPHQSSSQPTGNRLKQSTPSQPLYPWFGYPEVASQGHNKTWFTLLPL